MKQRISAKDTDHVNSGYYFFYILVPATLILSIIALARGNTNLIIGGVFGFVFSLVGFFVGRFFMKHTVNAEIDDTRIHVRKGKRHWDIPFDKIHSVKYFVNSPPFKEEPIISIKYLNVAGESKRVLIYPTLLNSKDEIRFNSTSLTLSRNIRGLIESKIEEYKEKENMA